MRKAMDNRDIKLLKKAGFCLWSDEKHRPPGAIIDWSCNYDDEVQKLIQLVRQESHEHNKIVAKIDEGLDQFDFEVMHKVMEFLGWQWETANSYHVPSQNELREFAKDLILRGYNRMLGDSFTISSGGFRAEVFGEGDEFGFTLMFVLADYES